MLDTKIYATACINNVPLPRFLVNQQQSSFLFSIHFCLLYTNSGLPICEIPPSPSLPPDNPPHDPLQYNPQDRTACADHDPGLRFLHQRQRDIHAEKAGYDRHDAKQDFKDRQRAQVVI